MFNSSHKDTNNMYMYNNEQYYNIYVKIYV